MKKHPRRRSSTFRWIAEFLRGAFLAALVGRSFATGWFGPPPRWLEEGGRKSHGVPEFFWDLELRRIAAQVTEGEVAFEYKPAAAQVIANAGADTQPLTAAQATAAADAADFADALKSGRITAADPGAAQAAHDAMRAWLDAHRRNGSTPVTPAAGNSPPDAPPAGGPLSEFADYHAGCLAATPDAAIAAWEKLLQRPAAERHYRSVWAEFMIGKARLDSGDWPAAAAAFQRCRALAREGFADSLGLAADSIGWEAYAELAQHHYPAAARLYLRQLAQGDSSAIVSLRSVVPATLPGFEGSHVADLTTEDTETTARWLEAARDPVLRQVVSAHVLATETGGWRIPVESARCLRWLRALDDAQVGKVDDAAPLGWTAYTTGKYDEAARWLEKESKPTPLGKWLRAKLALRAGRYAEAARLMPGVLDGLPPDDGLREPDLTYLPRATARADLAAAHLSAGRFSRALEEWYLGYSESDCAHLAERVLTTAELGAFIAKHMPGAPDAAHLAEAAGPWPRERIQVRLRSIYGRRLVREGRVREARPFLTTEAQAALDRYLAATSRSENRKAPAAERARAWFDAAMILRRDGLEFRGTIEEFNALDLSGAGHQDPLVAERTTGRVIHRTWDAGATAPQTTSEPVLLTPGREERRRLAATAPQRALSNRTPILAANLARKSAALLPDNSEELADVLNTAGDWIEDLDNPAADRIYFQLEARCPNTAIGKAALDKHWFTREPGPWSKSTIE